VGNGGLILKTSDGGGTWVEEAVRGMKGLEVGLRVIPNPFISYATLPGHSSDHFSLYDISGRKVGTFRGDRIGVDLEPGVYFLRSLNGDSKPVRIVKVR
jgi:hypothetical protein